MPVTDTSNERRGKRGETPPPPVPSLRELARRARESAPPPERAPRDRAPDLASVSTTPLADPDYELVPVSQRAPDSVGPVVDEPAPDVRPSAPVVLLSRAVVACAATFAFGAVVMFATSHWLARPARAADAAAAVEVPAIAAPVAAAEWAVEAPPPAQPAPAQPAAQPPAPRQPAPATKAHAADAAPTAKAVPPTAVPAESAEAAPTEDAEATAADAAFDQQAAVAAIDAAAGAAAGCGDGSGARRARVVMTFAPSGHVTHARVEGDALAGTETGGCVASAMRTARVPPFDGPAVTVQKTVVVR
jgi:hypothetical protein